METLELSRILEAKSQPPLSPAFSEHLGKWLALFVEHYQQQLSDLAVFGYRQVLKGLTVEELDRGCEKALSECSFIPKAADILRYAKDVSAPSDYYIPERHSREEQVEILTREEREAIAKQCRKNPALAFLKLEPLP